MERDREEIGELVFLKVKSREKVGWVKIELVREGASLRCIRLNSFDLH